MSLELIENIHKVVYPQLEEMVQKLDERLELKLYAIVLQEDRNPLATRIKRVLTSQRGEETEVKLEKLDGPEDALAKLGLSGWQWGGTVGQLDEYIRKTVYNRETSVEVASEKLHMDSAGEGLMGKADSTVTHVHTTTSILYPNQMNLTLKGKKFELIYILAIDAGPQVCRMFYKKPQISFLRMTLDYYFDDYYKEDKNNRIGEALESKYKENTSGFLQRMARMFLGKIQQYIIEGGGEGVQHFSSGERESNQQYYINMLMEKIEGIATRTYEGESPFGCMLLMSPKLLNERTGLVKYAIQFEGENGISLDDGRRIRKLLEMTNNENDLFLIADERIIYGIGEVDWSLLGTDSVFKLEFKGLSRYDLMLIRMKEEEPTDKRVESDEGKKIFKMTSNLRIVSDKLLGVSFKNPEIGQERFDLDLFKRITLATFKGTTNLDQKNLDKLGKMIKEATQQQSGTMVVITEPDTAKDEVKRLKKQSTPILKTQLNPIFIKHLTAIDGALYCDTDANCHAIGVILDGLSQEHLGDASRGARFNSAYKYLEKLKMDKAPCVIAIISEDGMVNLIPEPITERTVRQIVKEYVDYIKETEKGKTIENKVKTYEERLQQARRAVEIDDDYFFQLGDAWFEHEDYFKSAEYYQEGIQLSNQLNIIYRRKLISSNYKCISGLGREERIPILENMLDTSNYIIDYGVTELTDEDYNLRGIAQYTLGIYCEDSKQKDEYFIRAMKDYTQSIILKKSKKWVLHSNRGRLNIAMERYEDALDDFISAELENSSDDHLNNIMKLAGKSSELLIHAITRYSERTGDDWGDSELGKQLMELGEQWATAYPEVAAAMEELKGDNSSPKDPNIEG